MIAILIARNKTLSEDISLFPYRADNLESSSGVRNLPWPRSSNVAAEYAFKGSDKAGGLNLTICLTNSLISSLVNFLFGCTSMLSTFPR